MVKNCIQMEMYRFGEKFKGVDCTGKKYMQTTRRLQILHDRKCGRKKSSEVHTRVMFGIENTPVH